MSEKSPHSAIPPDHPTAEEMRKLRETFFFIERVCILAINRLGGTMAISDKEWASADGADMQWRTMKVEGKLSELHIAVTLMSERINVTNRDIANLRDEKAKQGSKH